MSKLLIPLLALLVVAWLWRSGRSRKQQPHTPPLPKPQPMIPCAYCGLHLPQSTAVHGAHGDYCCQDHLRAAQDIPAHQR